MFKNVQELQSNPNINFSHGLNKSSSPLSKVSHNHPKCIKVSREVLHVTVEKESS